MLQGSVLNLQKLLNSLTSSPKPGTLDPKPSTLNRKPSALNPKPSTLNLGPKPPQPQLALDCGLGTLGLVSLEALELDEADDGRMHAASGNKGGVLEGAGDLVSWL